MTKSLAEIVHQPFTPAEIATYSAKIESLEEAAAMPIKRLSTVEGWLTLFFIIGCFALFIGIFVFVVGDRTPLESFGILGVDVVLIFLVCTLHTSREKVCAPFMSALGKHKKMPEYSSIASKIDYQLVERAAKAVNTKQGSVEHYMLLAQCYVTGDWVGRDMECSFALYKRAANLGDVSAAIILGDMFDAGTGMQRCEQQAYEWYQRAQKLGSLVATQKIKVMEFAMVQRDIDKKIARSQRHHRHHHGVG
jgi:TPR repeat protein